SWRRLNHRRTRQGACCESLAMALGKPRLTVKIAPAAVGELKAIWRYNAEHRGIKQADNYEVFLRRKISGLATKYGFGNVVNAEPAFRYIVMKVRNRGDGHVAVYYIDLPSRTVQVLHLFHTKQDWQSKL